ncbi:DUF2059 domain-containing protein [Olleya aquimaris]|uniref:DUF2059 domain-containing protein n=1 Tax=Olleya aquimaris TaxID=639310 RepID=A0A327RBB0_9FLAO|nr:DUF2059 domain-containing protein [Olleya aquimaris]RAJ13395.1 hypothetical protein LY08_01912 [Olleya aquimaris]
MKKIFTLICFLAIGTLSFAQVDAYSEDVKKCIKSNGTLAYYEDVIDQMFSMLEQQFASQEVPADVWTELKKVKPESMDELAQMIVSAYRAHFTHQDVKNMNALYATKAGQNMFKPEALSEGDKIILKEFYQSETGQKIVSSQDSMNASMSDISIMWSGDLYKSMIAKLSEKGYTI